MGVGFVALGFVLGLLGSVLALLLVFFSRAKKHKPPASALQSDFIAPTVEFVNSIGNVSRVRVPDAEEVDSLCDSMLRQQGVLPQTYEVEKEVARLGTWAGCLFGMGNHNPQLPAWLESSWSVGHVVLLPRALMLVFSETGSLRGMVHLERCQVEPYEHKTDEVASCGMVKLFNTGNAPICSFSNACTLYLLFASHVQQKNWLANLMLAVVECDHAMDRAFSKSPPPAWLGQLDSERGGEQNLEWLNLFLERYFSDMFQSQTYYYRTMKMLSDKLLLIRKPAWIGSVNLKELNIGNANININFVSFCSGNQPKEMLGVVDLVYKGGLRISYGAVLNIGKSLRVPVEVLVHLESLSGRLYLSCPATLHTKWSGFFRQMPAVNVTVKVIVGGLSKSVEVTSLNKLHKFAQKTFLKQVELALVFPSRLRFFLPLAGRKSQLKSLRFNPELGGYQYVLPLDPSQIAQEKAKYHSPLEDRKDVASVWEMRGTLKADLREFILRRLFCVVLNLGYVKLFEQLMSPTVRVVGGIPQIEHIGHAQVFEHFKGLYLSFDDFELQLLSIAFDANGDASCRWRATGIHARPLWELPASGKRVALMGLSLVTFEPGQLRIIKMKTFHKQPVLTPVVK